MVFEGEVGSQGHDISMAVCSSESRRWTTLIPFLASERLFMAISGSYYVYQFSHRKPRRCCSVTFSFVGSSIISIPNVCCSMSCASPKTCLNCRPFVASTFWAMSARRMGCREYSQLRAYRTSFRASVSTASLVDEPLVSSSPYALSETGLWSSRARFPRCSG